MVLIRKIAENIVIPVTNLIMQMTETVKLTKTWCSGRCRGRRGEAQWCHWETCCRSWLIHWKVFSKLFGFGFTCSSWQQCRCWCSCGFGSRWQWSWSGNQRWSLCPRWRFSYIKRCDSGLISELIWCSWGSSGRQRRKNWRAGGAGEKQEGRAMSSCDFLPFLSGFVFYNSFFDGDRTMISSFSSSLFGIVFVENWFSSAMAWIERVSHKSGMLWIGQEVFRHGFKVVTISVAQFDISHIFWLLTYNIQSNPCLE